MGDPIMGATVVRAPSSIANLGYGFDSPALAVDYAYDVVAVEPIPEGDRTGG